MTKSQSSNHTFHVPVMGTGFTADAPLRVAKYGISSVVSLVDDILLGQLGKYHADLAGEPYEEVAPGTDDPRARRITIYLNFLNKMIKRQVEELQSSPFESGSEITRYFELLPDNPLKRSYQEMLDETNADRKLELQDELRGKAVPGSIDVNIMTKLNCPTYKDGEQLPREYDDALAALRGFALSHTSSAMVLSAGMNPALFAYFTKFEDFYHQDGQEFKKQVTLKVSDYRSAEIQAKLLAKKGIWVSEFRVESGLNCGGHAFATKGFLIGPILEEFKLKRTALLETLFGIYLKALARQERFAPSAPPSTKITMQGGIGVAAEQDLLLEYYNVDATGWATPFLLVPEVSAVDDEHLEKLSAVTNEEVYLSNSSPLGIPFWNLRNSSSEMARRQRLADGRPGSACPKGFAASSTEFSERLQCLASRAYQKKKLPQLAETLSGEELTKAQTEITDNSCICHELGGSATTKYGIDPTIPTSICCGPNIVNFSKIASLEEMVGHIYGRISILTNPERPHMFVRELMIYIDHLRDEGEKRSRDLSAQTTKYYNEFKENLFSGIDYYLELADQITEEARTKFCQDIKALRKTLELEFATLS